MAYDWTGETTRRKNRVKMVSWLLIGAAALALPAIVLPLVRL